MPRNTFEQDQALVLQTNELFEQAAAWATSVFSKETAFAGHDSMTTMFMTYLVAELQKLGWKPPLDDVYPEIIAAMNARINSNTVLN